MRAFKVWKRNALVWRKHFKASIIGNLGEPFLFLIAMGYGLGKTMPVVANMSYLEFIAPGLAASAVMFSAALETTYGSYTRLATQKTYEAILMTPVSVYDLALGEMFWGATKGLISGLIMIALFPLFGIQPSLWTFFIPFLLFLEGMIFAACGVIMTAIAQSYEFFNYFMTLFINPLFLFSGILFPMDSLHPALKVVFMVLPLSHAVQLYRGLTYGRTGDWWLHLLVLASYAVFLVLIAFRLLKGRLIK
jgi:lipooligosaccharide transport system permease protein